MRRSLVLLSLAAFVAMGPIVAANAQSDSPEGESSASPSIRPFSIATIEKLGRAIYEQDALVANATQMAFAHFSDAGLKAQKVDGWIVEPAPGGTVVRFVHDTPDGPRLFYDVNFAANRSPSASTPANARLNEREQSQYAARQLALANTTLKCSSAYNTTVLKDPEHDGWLVWVMAATKDQTVAVIGGHTRFSISGDGQSIEQADPLSRSCLVAPLTSGGQKVSELLVSQVVSQTPVETHVFESLVSGVPIYVGTLDGVTWKVSEGRISQVDMASPDSDGYAARHFASQDERCKAVAVKAGENPPKAYMLAAAPVIVNTEPSKKFSFQGQPGFRTLSMMCGRRDIVPAPNDWKVIAAGYTLIISDIGLGHAKRLGALELKNGKLQFRITNGDPLSPDVQSRVNRRLGEMQSAFQDR